MTQETENKLQNSLLDKRKDLLFHDEFMPHIDSMYNFAYKLTFDEDEAKDLVQDTYLKAYRFISSFQEGTNSKAWLYRILKNNFINEYRKKSKQPEKVDYQDIAQYHTHEEGCNFEGLSMGLQSEGTKKDLIGDEVTNALNSIAIDFRTIIILRDIEGFSYEEMSKILDISIGTVRSRLHRARKLLREKLVSYAHSMGYN